MKNQPYILLLWMLFLSFFVEIKAANEFYFSHLGVENGLSQSSILCIYQDTEGYLWFGTQNGANKYDGYEFTVYRHEISNLYSLSDGHINAINEDQSKNIWLATPNGLNCIDNKTDTIYRIYPSDIYSFKSNAISVFLKHQDGSLYAVGDKLLFRCNPDHTIENLSSLKQLPENIHSIMQDRNGDIYIGTSQSGIFIYNTEWELKKQLIDTNEENTFSTTTITSLLELDGQRILIGTDNLGLFIYNRVSQNSLNLTKENSDLSNNQIHSIIKYKENKILIGTFGGLNLLDLSTQSISSIKGNPKEKGSLRHFSIYSMFIDHTQTLWVGTYSAGVNFYSPYFKPSSSIIPEEFTGVIRRGQKDKSNNLWFATEGGGLLFHNIQTGEQTLYPLKSRTGGNYEQNILRAFFLENNTILCSDHTGKVYLFSIEDKIYKEIYNFGPCDIYSIYVDSKKRIWIPTNSEMGLILIENKKISHTFEANDKQYALHNISILKELSPHLFLLGTLQDSLYLYDIKNKILNNISGYIQPQGKYESLGMISGIETEEQYIWISTTKSGLYQLDYNFKLMKHYHLKDGLPGSYISSMSIDKQGDIWVTTGNLIYKLYRNDDIFRLIKPWNIPSQDYTLCASFVTSEGSVYFPGNKAIHVFEPQHINKNPHPPLVYITAIHTDDMQELTYSHLKKNEISPKDYSYHLTIPHDIKNISIRYTGINFIHANENVFTVKLDGVDKQWIKVGNRREVYYNNLQPGKYKLRIKAGNIDGAWTDKETFLYITVKPPFYKTWWAFLIYLLTFTFIVYNIISYQHQKQNLKREIKYKQLEKENMKELHSARIRMFRNISHELRTPLTLIINPLNELLDEIGFSKETKEALQLMKKNTNRLLSLVNNLMDIQKYEAGQFTLEKKRFYFSIFIKGIYHSFESIATNRNINFLLDIHIKDNYAVMYDEKEIEKVLFNLLTNAFKFTPSKGEIGIIIKNLSIQDCLNTLTIPISIETTLNEQEYLYIEIYDTGKGFPQEDALKIFDIFYQSGSDLHKEISGTGIGLNLTRFIIQQHNGYIWADSIPEKGTHFSILLPKGEAVENELLIDPEKKKIKKWIAEYEKRDKKSILIVDDNQDILDYLGKKLQKEFRIIKAMDGKEAFEQVKETTPDLVISDILMPGINGLNLCKMIKNDPQFSHIPVILLTSLNSETQIQEGYKIKADDYITKPFSMPLLKSRIKNILSLHENMKITYSDTFSLKKLGLEEEAKKNEFLAKYMEIVKEHLADQNFDISIIYNSLHMTRPTFYRKVKTLTRLSPVELITHIRMEVAAKLLLESSMTITEIAQTVGYSSRSYFTKTFKNLYGKSPSEYQQNNKV